MKYLVEFSILLLICIINAFSFEKLKKKSHLNSNDNIDNLYEVIHEKAKTRSWKNKNIQNRMKYKEEELDSNNTKATEKLSVNFLDEKDKLIKDFSIDNKEKNYNNPSRNSLINDNKIIAPIEQRDNTFRNDYTLISNNNIGNNNLFSASTFTINNEDIEKKFSGYRSPEYVHVNYKSVSGQENEDNFYDNNEDPIFLEAKMENQNRLKVPIQVADRFTKLSIPDDKPAKNNNNQEIVFNSNQDNLNFNYKYSKAKIITNKEDMNKVFSDNSSTIVQVEVIDNKRKINNQIILHNNKTGHIKIHNENETLFNKTRAYADKIISKNNLNQKNEKIQMKKMLEKCLLYKNLTINSFSEFQNISHDLNALKIPFLNFINYDEYINNNRTFQITVNLNFQGNYSNNQSYNISNKISVVDINEHNKNHIRVNSVGTLKKLKQDEIEKKNKKSNIKNNLENKIKDFIHSKINEKELNFIDFKNVSDKQIKEIVKDFHLNQKHKNSKATDLKSINNKTHYDNTSMKILYKKIDAMSEKLTKIFKKVLRDIIDNPTDYTTENKTDNNLNYLQSEIKQSILSSIANHIPEINLNKSNAVKVHLNSTVNLEEKINKTMKNFTDLVSKNFKIKQDVSFIEAKKINFNKHLENLAAQQKIAITLNRTNQILRKNKTTSINKFSNKEIQELIKKKKIVFEMKKLHVNKASLNNFIFNKTNRMNNAGFDNKNALNHTSIRNSLKNMTTKITNNTEIMKKAINHIKVNINKYNRTQVKNKSRHNVQIKVNNKKLDMKPAMQNETKVQQQRKLNKTRASYELEKIIKNNSTLFELQKKIGKSLPELKINPSKKHGILKTNYTSIDRNIQSNLTQKKINAQAITDKPYEFRTQILNRSLKNLDKTNHIKESIARYIPQVDHKIKIDSTFLKNKRNEREIIVTENKNESKIKQIHDNKPSIVHEDLEVDDGSMMAEILKAYKKRFNKKH